MSMFFQRTHRIEYAFFALKFRARNVAPGRAALDMQLYRSLLSGSNQSQQRNVVRKCGCLSAS
jgi:hypothetical protein